jgi:TolA-binding protein
MTAKEEDILSNQSYIQKGVVLDKLLESLTMNKFDIKDLFIGDKNAILVASRVLGYGKDYSFEYKGQSHTVDLSKLENKPFNESLISSNGTISYTLPKTENKIEFKFLNETDEKKINEELLEYANQLQYAMSFIVSKEYSKAVDALKALRDSSVVLRDDRKINTCNFYLAHCYYEKGTQENSIEDLALAVGYVEQAYDAPDQPFKLEVINAFNNMNNKKNV